MTYTVEQMELKAHIEAENAEHKAEMERNPGLWISMMTTDLDHWAEYDIYNVDQYQSYLYYCTAYEIISDKTSKAYARTVLADCATLAEMQEAVSFYRQP